MRQARIASSRVPWRAAAGGIAPERWTREPVPYQNVARPMSRNIPEKFGRYTIEEELGRGTMGVVYRAFDPVLGRAIALKTIHLAHALSKRRRGAFEQRFLTEARVAAKLQHPGIVVVHDLGRDSESGDLFIALELLVGENLVDWIEEDQRPEWREALRIVARVAEALHHAHVRGVVHRDVKPANIIVLESGQPKIMDFGIAKIEAGQLTTPGELFGTPLYMSPEQALGKPAGPRSDIFSLGSVAYALLTGRLPFRAPDVPGILARVAHLDPALPSEIVPGLPADVDYVVARAMAKDPEQRHPDAQALAEDVEDIRQERPPRHRGDWQMPERGGDTVISREVLESPQPAAALQTTSDRRRHSRRAASRRRSFLWLCLAVALVALAFKRDPGLTTFWRSAAAWVGAERFRPGTPMSAAESWPLPSAAVSPDASPAPASPSPAVSPAEAPTPPSDSVLPSVAATPPSTPEATPTPAVTPEPTPSPSPRATPSPTPTMPAQTSPQPTPRRSPKTLSSSAASATLRIDVETRVKGGSLQVWVDDRPALTTRLDGRSAPVAVRLLPGSHEIRVQLRSATSADSASVKATFSARQPRRLGARLVKGKLTLRWK